MIFTKLINTFFLCVLFIFVCLRLDVDEGVSADASLPLRVGVVRLRGLSVPRVHNQLRDDVDGDREHDRAVVLRRDAVQGLEIPSKMFA